MEKKKILVIDDSSTALALMEYTLKDAGYNMQLAASVKEALKFMETGLPDLIILDLSMPEISGYTFLQMMKEKSIDNIPVIVVSALDSPDSVKEAKELGAQYFIPKPLNIKMLLEKITVLTGNNNS